MKILIIEDTDRNVSPEALAGLEMHEVTIVQNYADAIVALKANGGKTNVARLHPSEMDRHDFDVVLTDLYLPLGADFQSNYYVSGKRVTPEGIHPVGQVLAMAALNWAAKTPFIAILTDASHHADFLSSLLDTQNVGADSCCREGCEERGGCCHPGKIYKFDANDYHAGCIGKETGTWYKEEHMVPKKEKSGPWDHFPGPIESILFIKNWAVVLNGLLNQDYRYKR